MIRSLIFQASKGRNKRNSAPEFSLLLSTIVISRDRTLYSSVVTKKQAVIDEKVLGNDNSNDSRFSFCESANYRLLGRLIGFYGIFPTDKYLRACRPSSTRAIDRHHGTAVALPSLVIRWINGRSPLINPRIGAAVINATAFIAWIGRSIAQDLRDFSTNPVETTNQKLRNLERKVLSGGS